uniref:Tudor domain-containing protein n=1 Tax=Romanomermis culicivorax TaxID=13658 RepID=A0A915ILQ8_ROMCU
MIDFYRSEDYGEKMKLNSQPVVVGSFYAVEVTNGTQPLFFRAFCSRIDDKTRSALLYLLDSGEFFTFTYQQLRFLPRRFRQLPSTVVQCSLAKVVRPVDITQYYDTNSSAAFSSKVLSRFHQFRLYGSSAPKNDQKFLSSSFENYCTLKRGADSSKPDICRTNVQEMVDIETNDNLIDWLLVHQYALPTEAVENQVA